MNKQTSWLDKRRGQVKNQVKHWGQALEQKMMAAQWRSASVDMLSFAFEPLWGVKQIPARVDAVRPKKALPTSGYALRYAGLGQCRVSLCRCRRSMMAR